jgi:hypothetical protein
VLRRIYELKRDEVTGRRRELFNEVLHNSYSATNIIRVIKSRRMRLAGRVGFLKQVRNAYRILVRNPERNNHSQ